MFIQIARKRSDAAKENRKQNTWEHHLGKKSFAEARRLLALDLVWIRDYMKQLLQVIYMKQLLQVIYMKLL